MIFEHEIPSGSHLYFDKSAKIKRTIESDSATLLERDGYHEIVTPLFSYHQHESFENKRPLVRLNDTANNEVTLRADSTADVVRIVTKRLGRSSRTKKWFYIQPVLTFPTIEQHQIGAEIIDGDFEDVCSMSIKLLSCQKLAPTLQISNIAIPRLLNKKYGVDLGEIRSMNIEAILQNKTEWMHKLIYMHKIEDIGDLHNFPEDIAFELKKIEDIARTIKYHDIVISPLYYAQMRYYNSLMFRMFKDNRLLAMGGIYAIDDVHAAGFAIYTDACIEKIIQRDMNVQ